MFSSTSTLLLSTLARFLATNVLCQPQFSHVIIGTKIRLSRISAEIFVQPAEFQKIRLRGQDRSACRKHQCGSQMQL